MFFQNMFGQELPPIKNFTPSEYNANSQNWSISQDNFGSIYIANTAGLLTYNGAAWKLYNTPNNSVMRSVKVIEDRAYVGFYMGFGYYAKNEKGLLEFTSLSNLFKEDLLEDEQFWQIEQYKDWILFRSLQRIYLYNTTTNTYQHYSTNNNINYLAVLNDGIYYHVSNEGIYTLNEGKEKLYLSNPLINTSKLVNLFEHKDELLIVTDRAGVYVISQGEMKPFNDGLNNSLETKTIYTAIKLKSNGVAIGTISDGVLLLNTEGEIENHINQEKGLTNNTILSLFEDRRNTLWLGTDYGINYINISNSLKIYNDTKGELGTIYDAAKYNDYLYLGTNQGLFYMSESNKTKYELIPNTSGQVWTLFEYDGTLFCGHDLGTFIVVGKKAVKIADIEGSWAFRGVKGNANILLQGNYNGIHVLEKVDGKWIYARKIKGFDYSSQFFEVVDNRIFVNHEFKGVYELEIDRNFAEITSVKKLDSFQTNQSSALGSYADQLYYASRQGFYGYDLERRTFVRNDSISRYIYDDFTSGRMSINEDGIWMFAKNGLINLKQGRLSKQLEFKKVPFPASLFSPMKGFQKLTKINDENYFVGSFNGYSLIDVNNSEQEKFEVQISEIKNYLNNGSLEEVVSFFTENQFAYDRNGFQMNYSAPYFNALNPVLYKTRLLGRSDTWSKFSEGSSVNYENLPTGDYTFQVQAKTGSILSNNIASYFFRIAKPWYRSYLAYSIYMLSFLMTAYFVHAMYQRYFKKQKQRLLEKSGRELALQELKASEQINKIEKNQLEKDIENKNRELAISTMSLINKNKLLSSIKKELLTIDKKKPETRHVIQIIDRNINNNNDWKFFEDAFNNADSNFLKKVKALHSNLTPNDLKLCAYLRLNLSSKEVAPLLNISSRSVEIKRYRLRKKMNLPHEKSLVNYILEV